MKILLTFLLLTLSTAVLSQTDPTSSSVSTHETTVLTTTHKDTSSTEDVTTTTPAPETTHSTSEAPTTKEPSTTEAPTTKEPSTTEAPTTKEPSTTEAPTTKEPSTTEAPTTKPTTPVPVTTSAPEPKPCTWNITRKEVTCIRAELKVQFVIPNEGNSSTIELGCDADSSGSVCSNDTQILNLVKDKQYNLTMIFEKESDKVFVRNITFDYVLSDGKSGSVANKDKLFSVKAGNSYLCRSKTSVNLENVTMEVEHIHIQAFEGKDSNDFSTAEECEADDKVSDVVPIAVGVALAALIIIVLIAYLVGRRRSRQKGYQSV